MPLHQHGDRLSWGDSVFLNLERDGMPLNVAGISIFEGDIEFESFLRFVESKLPLIPRYLKRVTPPPFNVGLPSWDYDPGFDIRNHMREVSLKHGSDAELKALAGNILGQVMDRQHPLWEMTLVRGLKGTRSALIARMHHCLADGIGGVGIMSLLMDASPVAPNLPKHRTQVRVPAPRAAVSQFMDGLVSSYASLMEPIVSTWTNVLKIAERTLAERKLADDEFSNCCRSCLRRPSGSSSMLSTAGRRNSRGRKSL